jgi:hypothetical protein
MVGRFDQVTPLSVEYLDKLLPAATITREAEADMVYGVLAPEA